ncbi:SDR family NAD(P)-dependent oxidoreductase [Ferroplasma acidiphilum]|uniref:SDR family NAD(P)-dependent oxidoreductase n=1 Tax=Ferroplasma acidiphilum TaxID=74969 RepID=UPI0023F33EEB|nr:SDR family oxidoreductase [Ferroplasma acidiphilum]MCL4348716.1 SDR family oxidoreductase [Candidatus Thermoplasmatota archaeon]
MKSNIVIAGVGRGMGSSLAYYLKDAGYNVFLISRGSNVKEVAGKTGCEFYNADLNSYPQCVEAIKAADRSMGGIDAVINVAGNYYSNKSIEETEPEMFVDAILNNARTFYNIARAAIPLLKRQKHGSIIGFSASENVYYNSNPGYAAGKGAVYFMVKSLARELIKYNIKVNGVAPGFIGKNDDEIESNVELGITRRYPPDDINRTVEFLINSEMVTGEIIPVAGGHDINLNSGI